MMMNPVRSDAWRDPRSRALLFVAGVFASRAVAYVPGTRERLPIGLREAALVLPVWLYGLMWAAAAGVAAGLALRQTHCRPWHAVMIVVPPTLWGALYATTSVVDGTYPAGYGNALLFWFLAGIAVNVALFDPRRR